MNRPSLASSETPNVHWLTCTEATQPGAAGQEAGGLIRIKDISSILYHHRCAALHWNPTTKQRARENVRYTATRK